DFALLDLSSATSTPVILPDFGNTEVAVTVADGYAYVGSPHFNDGRIRTNVYALVKVADFDVPNFDARYGVIDGTRLYLTSATGPDMVVVDLSTPTAPAVLGRKTMPANGGRSGIINTSVFTADSTSGLAEI